MHKWFLPLFASLWLAGCSDNNWRTTDISEVMPDLDFELVDENGRDVSAGDYLGKTTVLYFGYTHCPDVCPITLAGLAAALRKFDEPLRDDIQVLFVSVDPARDTPAILKRYTDVFGPQFIGLTGDIAQIDALTNRYRIAYEYGDKDSTGNYEVSHSSAVFAFDPRGEARLLIRDSDPQANVVADLRRLTEKG